MIPEYTVSRIKADFPMENLLEKSQNNLYCCPFCGSGHGPNRTGALQVYRDNNSFQCHKCGAHGDVLDLLQHIHHCGFQEAVTIAAQRLGVPLEQTSPERTGPEQRREHLYPQLPGERGRIKKVIDTRDGKKRIQWLHQEGEAWMPGRKGYPPRLYVAGGSLEDAQTVVVVEGEKDAESVAAFGCVAVSGENGAACWKEEYNHQLVSKNLVLMGDNDPPGQAYLDKVVRGMSAQAKSIRRLDLCALWPELPRGGDVSDYIAHVGAQEARTRLRKLMRETAPLTLPKKKGLMDLFRPLSEYEQEELEWLIPGWMPKGGVVIVAGDGGAGKTHLLANITAAVTKGGSCILGDVRAEDAGSVMFVNREDSVKKVLKKLLKNAGVDETKTIVPDFDEDHDGLLSEFLLGSETFLQVIRDCRPRMVVIDPLQAFLSDRVDMSSRNQMRQCLQPLVHLGAKLGCTFLVLCHTNKQTTVSGRSRVADSSDLWDISRCLIMVGLADEAQGLRFISQEKNSYGEREDTILFSITDTGVQYQGTSTKRDGEFHPRRSVTQPQLTKREQAKELILSRLRLSPNGAIPMTALQKAVETAKISAVTLRRAREELIAEGKLQTYLKGNCHSNERKS